MKWTDEQLQAITATGGTLLVSAAAGSGKTAVLVERVIGRLINAEEPCGVDNLLMVTFTRAAAAQMRERISEAIAKRIAENPNDKWLVRQQMLLPFARICTIDSFCNDLVRENFHLLDLNPDYKIMDEGELNIVREDAAAFVVETLYQENSPAACDLTELLIQGNDDRVLIDSIIRLYNESQAYPAPEQWLQRLIAPFESAEPVEKSAWGKIILAHIREGLDYCRSTSEAMLRYIAKDETVEQAYTPTFLSDINLYNDLLLTLDTGTWDAISAALQTAAFDRIGTLPRGFLSPVKDSAHAMRNSLKDVIKKQLAPVMCASSAEHEEDIAYLAPIVKKLVDAVLMFKSEFTALKNEVNGVDFSDIHHNALQLLVAVDDQGNGQKTPLAEEIAKRYKEVLVDEYQDVNKAQDMLFTALSKDEKNLFMVGDVKQSIYRFRQAMPEIFLARRDSMPPYKTDNYPARIHLGTNFRSRKGVTGMVNLVFGQLMSKAVGEIAYTAEEELVPGAQYPDSNAANVRIEPEAEVHIIDISDGVEDSKANTEARYIADLINNMILNGFTVTDKNGVRLAEYRDFCVLMRSPRDRAAVFVEEFARGNIPAYSDLSGGFFEAQEVAFILSLMRVLDNPLQDIPLLTVLLAPVFGFTPDEVAKLRIGERRAPLYGCLVNAQNQGDEKCRAFLKQMEQLRRLSSTLAAGELVRHLLEETGYLAIAGAMPGGARRRANLHLLQDYANTYEAAGHIGLSGFIRFIDKLDKNQGDLSPAVELSEAANVVRVMSIHKSKGLEFPVCILANCASTFNTAAQRGNIVINNGAGIGLRRRDIETFRQFDTISRQAAVLATAQTDRSEELRILYVALTRAKERLITVMSLKNPEKKLASLAGIINSGEKIAPFAVGNCTSIADWLLLAALRHPDAGQLRQCAGADGSIIVPADFALKVECNTQAEPLPQDESDIKKAESDKALMAIIEKRLSYEYPYAALSGVVAKQAASELHEQGIKRAFFAASRPAFMNQDGLTPAQKGTAIHKFMQFSDYEKARQDVAAERDRLVAMGFLSALEGDAVDVAKINTFFASPLARRIFNAQKLLREQKFAIRIPVCELYPDLPENTTGETVVVQGIADCAFVEQGELVILDYKTDRGVTQELLAERYAPQLAIYRRALAESLEIKVKQTLLYSFELGKAVPV